MNIFGREPAFWVGVIVSVILAVVQTLGGQGLISDALQGQITDVVTAISQVVLLLIPVITAILIRPAVTPIVNARLKEGSRVTVLTPGSSPNPTITVTSKAA